MMGDTMTDSGDRCGCNPSPDRQSQVESPDSSNASPYEKSSVPLQTQRMRSDAVLGICPALQRVMVCKQVLRVQKTINLNLTNPVPTWHTTHPASHLLHYF